jgi:hypothetical protein
MNRENEMIDLSGKIIRKVLKSGGFKKIILSVIRDTIKEWSSGSKIKNKISGPFERYLSKAMNKKYEVRSEALSGDMGALFTLYARYVNEEHARDPKCHAKQREPSLNDFISSTDFGEIREMVENSEECALKTVEAFNETLWKYPAKVASILGTLLAATNTGIRSGREILRPIEQNVGPDLLADISLSLLKGLNAQEAGNLINALCEFVRRLHTGNYLLAKAGKPLFQIYLTDVLEEAFPNIDPVLLRKAKIALAEDREAVSNALADALTEHPDLMLEIISAYGSTRTPLIKGKSRKVRLFEEMDREQLADAVSEGLSDLDTFEIAEVINGFLRTINSIHESRPEVFSTIACSIADSIDAEELRAAAGWFIPEIVEAAQPVIAPSMPAIINAFCDILNPQEGIVDERHQEAMGNLKAVLLAAGGER